MTLNAHPAPTFPLAPPCAPQAVRPADDLFGTFVLEALSPGGDLASPALPGWELRVWPVARLGDVTLEARPQQPWLGPDDLRAGLRGEGWTPLGPVRRRRG